MDGHAKGRSLYMGAIDVARHRPGISAGTLFARLLRMDFRDAHGQDVAVQAGVYKTLLESTKAIPWKIEWASMRFAYIGPQIEQLLGWEQGSWRTVDDWVSRMHPDDREYVVDFCVSQSKAGVDHEADYRALTADGGYVWIRDVVHVVRTATGEVDSLIGFMFDISERKRAEDEVLRLHRELETLSLTDGLTGIANRRMFDQRFETEWNDARRSHRPISLVSLDIDYFKQFNDGYGHLQGDECLQRIARALKQIARRPRDLAARFGGEEFILLLPDTPADAALEIAESCARAIMALQIPHAGSEASGMVTASFGVGTVVVAADAQAIEFLDAVDRALYAAKAGGRNRIEVVAETA